MEREEHRLPFWLKVVPAINGGRGLVLIDFFLGGGGFFFLFLYSLGPEGFVG